MSISSATMKLTQATLPDYFTIADHTNSWYTQATNTFDFVDRNSDTLVVTVGDSWTWGCDLTPYDYDNNYRIQNVYGNQVAEKINSDWLNLSLPASGNFWLATQVTDLAKVIPNLKYNRIYVICTFTESGRWFNTKFDLDIDYIAWFKNNIQTASDFDQLLSMFNQRCVTKIQTALPFDHVQLRPSIARRSPALRCRSRQLTRVRPPMAAARSRASSRTSLIDAPSPQPPPRGRG